MALTLVITNAGRAALVNAANTGTAPTMVSQVGLSSTAVTASASATTLPGEFKRLGAVSGDVVADDTIHLIVRDEGSDVYTVRSFALYLADGTLFALYGQASSIADKAAQAILLLALDVRLTDITATSLTFGDANFLNPPATETVKGVAEIATQAEVFGQTDDARIVTPKKLWTAIIAWLATYTSDFWRASNDGAGSGLDADLLDGQQGSWYSNIFARLGFTPANKAGDTFTGQVTVQYPGIGLAVRGVGVGGYQGFSTQHTGVSAAAAGTIFHDFQNENGLQTGHIFHGLYPDGSTDLGFAVTPAGSRLVDRRVQVFGIAANGAYIFGNVVWNAGNDGSGSGLDADLLDGWEASAFVKKTGDTMSGGLGLPSVVVLGAAGTNGLSGGTGDGASYSVYNLTMDVWFGLGIRTYDGSVNGFYDARAGLWDVRSGYRVNGVATWHGANDGAGSGLDADMLDGQQGSWYADILARLGFRPVENGTGIGQLGNIIKLGWSGSRLKATVDAGDQGNVVFDGHIADVWRASNDGAGSGLDADLLDGQQGSWYSPAAQQFGVGQAWTDQTGHRDSGATYTNTTSRPITVKVIGATVSGTACSITVDGVKVAAAGTYTIHNAVYDMTAIVPAGASYVITCTLVDTIAELR